MFFLLSNNLKSFFFLSFLITLFSQTHLNACTRVLYVADDQMVITGRSMDWMEEMQSNLWVFPRGMVRDSGGLSKGFSWTSKYGSVIVCYNMSSPDGINEKGLVANLLYLAESDFGTQDGQRPIMSISLWAQYVLDNFATVAEAVEALRKKSFQIVAPLIPNGKPANLHLSISDSKGDSAIFQYIKGELVIYHGKQYQIMTNSPTYDQQLALNTYWESIGGLAFLPGTNRAADRFARASFLNQAIPRKKDPSFINAVPDKKFEYQAVASVLSVVRSVSVPLGITTPNEPNIASTIWRTVSDQKNKIFYYDSATLPCVCWLPLDELNLNQGAPVMKLKLAEGQVYSGNAMRHLVQAKPFEFLPAHP